MTASPAGKPNSATAVSRTLAPGGAWCNLDNGTYLIWLQKRPVYDLDGPAAAKQQLGSLMVALAQRRSHDVS
jgi:hypothetical protein